MKVTVLVILAVLMSCGEGNEVRVVEEQSTTPQEVTHTSSEVGPIDPQDEVEAPASMSENHSSETLGKKPTSEVVQAPETSGIEAVEAAPTEELFYDHPLSGTYYISAISSNSYELEVEGNYEIEIKGTENGILLVSNGYLDMSLWNLLLASIVCNDGMQRFELEELEPNDLWTIVSDTTENVCVDRLKEDDDDKEEDDDEILIRNFKRTENGFERIEMDDTGDSFIIEYTRK